MEGIKMKADQKIILVAISLLALASVAVCLEEVKADETVEYQTYEYSNDVVSSPYTRNGNTSYYVYLGDGKTHATSSDTMNTNKIISNKEKWDTSKVLRTSNDIRLYSEGLCNINEKIFLKQIQMEMIVGGNTSGVKTMAANTEASSATQYTFEAGGLTGTLKLGTPSTNGNFDSINWYKTNGTPTDLLKVTDAETFKTVPSPVVFRITVGTGDDAVTSEIQVAFDDSDHKAPVTGSGVTISSEVKNGYSVLDVSVNSTYAGTDNYLLAIAKYEGSVVYNSYLEVPSSDKGTVRMAFSNEGLKEVVIEIVSSNDAFGDSVPEYLAYKTYVPSTA